MGDDTNTPLANAGSEESGRGRRDRGPRDGGPREGGPGQAGQRDAGGFRIRLSDNELQAARALQEAFGLRSTVAVLGFALRTLAQQLEAGQLDELVAQQRAQNPQRPPAPRGGGSGGGDREGRRGEGRGPGQGGGGGGRAQRIDPFARPSRPAAKAESEPEGAQQDGAEVAPPDLTIETGSEQDSAAADPADGSDANQAASPEADATGVSAGDDA